MSFLPEEVRLEGRTAPGPASSFSDVIGAAAESTRLVDNFGARWKGMEEAYDRRIDAVFNATGRRLPNPFRDVPDDGAEDARPVRFGPRQARRLDVTGNAPEAPELGGDELQGRFMSELAALAEQQPDQRHIIMPDRSPADDARETAQKAARTLEDVVAQYRGVPGSATVAQFAGGAIGMAHDPTNVALMAIGPTGRAAAGLRGLAWMAVKNGVANAAVEAGSQPWIAAWRKEAGLGYDAGDFASNVGGAFLFGAGLDASVRGAIRGIQRGRGRVPILDEQGGIVAWERPEQAAERLKLRSSIDLIRKAQEDSAEGDAALRKLAEESGAANDPLVRSALDQLDDVRATSGRAPGLNDLDVDIAERQALRHLHDEREPPPGPVKQEPMVLYRAEHPNPEFKRDKPGEWYADSLDRAQGYAGDGFRIVRVEVPHERIGDLKPSKEVPGEFVVPKDLHATAREVDGDTMAARAALASGDLDTAQAAALMRSFPGAVDGSLPETLAMRDAKAIAGMGEDAADAAISGHANPTWAAMVARMVPDQSRHASILAGIERMRPQSAMEARHYINLALREAERGAEIRNPWEGIDDVNGAEAAAQIERLERSLGDGKPADVPPKSPDTDAEAAALKEAPDVDFREQLDRADTLERLAELMAECKL